MNELFLEAKGITKKFGEVVAVDNVDLNIYRGQIQGLIGENGSGKSTISQVISGIYPKAEGQMFIEGKEYKHSSPLDAIDHKISMIVQETGTIDNLSIAENIFLGQEKQFTKFLFLNKSQMNKKAKEILALVGLQDLDVTIPINSYSFEVRKMVEIAKALSIDPDLFIVDETTTALSEDGRQKIHQIMNELKDKNKAVLFISHDLEELMKTCDSMTVLRDGKLITTINKNEFDEDYIKKNMVGRQIQGDYYRSDYDSSCSEKITLEGTNITTNILNDVSITLHEGEIVGIGGLSQCGMHELARALFGMDKLQKGEIKAYAKRKLTFKEKCKKSLATLTKKEFKEPEEEVEYKITSIDQALKASIGYISKNRDKETLILPASIKDNLVISNLDNLSIFGIITPKAEKKFSKEIVESFNIKCSSINQSVNQLSGGNKQKVSFAKWIGNNSKILVFDSPTRGVDVLVKTTMYQLLSSLKKQGYSILIVSEELPELIGMSDRILIMKDGKITKEFSRSKDLKEEDIINYMI